MNDVKVDEKAGDVGIAAPSDQPIISPVQNEHLKLIMELPSAYVNLIFAGIEEDNFKLTFCERDSNSNCATRASIIMSTQTVFNLVNILNQVITIKMEKQGLQQQQASTNIKREGMAS